ncbi:MAG: methionine aminotransferase [Gammaproteobacteria bacterium]|nr:methionine aminotransferase [Gammaproteobacteria bacterium]
MQSKLPATGTTIFAVMSALSEECGAINLSQGFPSFDPPQELLDRVTYHLQNGANQYAPMQGTPALRNAVAEKIAMLYDRTVDPDTSVTVTDGATEALFAAIHAVVQPGDEVIVFDPAYDSYEPAVTLAGGRTIHLPLVTSDIDPDFHIDYDRLRDSINSRTRLIILNFPHNPTGVIFSKSDLDTLAEILRDTEIFLLSDEVYEHIVFDGQRHWSLVTHDELWERSFVVSSFGKTYHATGWKVGYCVAPPALTKEFRKIHQWICYTVITPVQLAIADYMQMTPEHYEKLPAFYQEKRDRFCELVAESRFSLRPAKGTFFQVLDYSEITDEDDVDYAKKLTHEIGVASIPVSVFCETPTDARLLRFCFAKDDEILKEAASRLCQL